MKNSKTNLFDLERIKFENERIWEYFQYHAKQRIETFKFFIILSGIIISGAITLLSRFQFKVLDNCCSKTSESMIDIYLIASLVLGLMLFIFSVIFYLLDQRNKTMINTAKKVMIKLEKSKLIHSKIFKSVEDATEITGQIGFDSCFKFIFFMLSISGLVIAVYSLIRLYC